MHRQGILLPAQDSVHRGQSPDRLRPRGRSGRAAVGGSGWPDREGTCPCRPVQDIDWHHLPWEPFSATRLATLTAAGKTVLIDFTADWCPNCKLNEFLALNTSKTADLVRRNGVVPLLADFTREDPEIHAWLGKFGSISVPLTVIVPGDRPSQPILLRDTYRQGTLLAALEQAGPSIKERGNTGGQAARVTQSNEAAAGTQRQALTLDTPIMLSETDGSVWWYLLAGFAGGFVLNFMPCVLPVISIKVLSLLGQAGQSRRRVLGLGLAFSAGMIALFSGPGHPGDGSGPDVGSPVPIGPRSWWSCWA